MTQNLPSLYCSPVFQCILYVPFIERKVIYGMSRTERHWATLLETNSKITPTPLVCSTVDNNPQCSPQTLLKPAKMFPQLQQLRHMNLDECLSYLQAHAFYITCIMIVGYLIYHSTPCTTLRHKFHYTISQNPVRVAKYEQRRKEIRLQQAIQFEKDLEDKRQERKKNGTTSTNKLSSPTYKPPKRKPYVSRGYNPLTGTGAGGFSSFKPQSRRKSGG